MSAKLQDAGTSDDGMSIMATRSSWTTIQNNLRWVWRGHRSSRKQRDISRFSIRDVDELFARVSNTSARFQVGVDGVKMTIAAKSPLDHSRAEQFRHALTRVHHQLGLPNGLDFVMNFHKEQVFPNAPYKYPLPPLFSAFTGDQLADVPIPTGDFRLIETSNSATHVHNTSSWTSRSGIVFSTSLGGWFTLANWENYPLSVLKEISRMHPDCVYPSLVQCVKCDISVLLALQSELLWSRWYPIVADLRQYQYVVDIEGSIGSLRFVSLLGNGAVVFKSASNHNKFFENVLKPFQHYIPVKSDLSNLVDQLEWARAHETETKEIVIAASKACEDLLEQNTWEAYMLEILSSYHLLFT